MKIYDPALDPTPKPVKALRVIVPYVVRPLRDALTPYEKLFIERALAANGGHRKRTALALGLSLRALQYKLRKHGLCGSPTS